MFESRVILDGSQTGNNLTVVYIEFESRVILDGSQTKEGLSFRHPSCLRVVLF